jgi:hypothetical protein
MPVGITHVQVPDRVSSMVGPCHGLTTGVARAAPGRATFGPVTEDGQPIEDGPKWEMSRR